LLYSFSFSYLEVPAIFRFLSFKSDPNILSWGSGKAKNIGVSDSIGIEFSLDVGKRFTAFVK